MPNSHCLQWGKLGLSVLIAVISFLVSSSVSCLEFLFWLLWLDDAFVLCISSLKSEATDVF